MKRLLLVLAMIALAGAGLVGFVSAEKKDADKVEAKGDKVDYDVHNGYFVSNKADIKDDAFLAFKDQETYDKVFGVGRVLGNKQNFLAKDAFDKKMVAAVVHKGNAITEYKVEKVTADGDTLYVQYTTTAKGGGGTASFASPLIVSTDKGKIATVVFIENGKKAGTAKIEAAKEK